MRSPVLSATSIFRWIGIVLTGTYILTDAQRVVFAQLRPVVLGHDLAEVRIDLLIEQGPQILRFRFENLFQQFCAIFGCIDSALCSRGSFFLVGNLADLPLKRLDFGRAASISVVRRPLFPISSSRFN